jgi:hypothetical protein
VTYTIIRNVTLRDLPAAAPDETRLFEDQKKFGVVSRRGLARLMRQCASDRACANKIYHTVDESMTLVP